MLATLVAHLFGVKTGHTGSDMRRKAWRHTPGVHEKLICVENEQEQICSKSVAGKTKILPLPEVRLAIYGYVYGMCRIKTQICRVSKALETLQQSQNSC